MSALPKLLCRYADCRTKSTSNCRCSSRKASLEHYTLQEVGKSSVLLDAAILLLDEAAEYLDELDQLESVTDEQAAKASILVAEAKVYANDAALHISEKLLELGGSRSSLSQHNLDQHWRNARVHTLHDPDPLEAACTWGLLPKS